MLSRQFLTFAGALLAGFFSYQSLAETAYGVKGSIINTTYNTYYKNGKWEATMGPLTPFEGGLACDQVASKNGQSGKYRRDDYAVWFIAPSDALSTLGIKACSYNAEGGEPSCYENHNLCGRKIRVTCRADSPWCARPGDPSLLAQLNQGSTPKNNYIPSYYQELTSKYVGSKPSVPRSIVLYITDFCPMNHSENKRSGHCQSPQVDVSTSAFLLLAKQNNQGYIDGGLLYDASLLSESDGSAAGPEW